MLNKELLYKISGEMGVAVSDEVFASLDKFAEMLVETNKQFNLTGITEPDDMTIKHFADSLSVFGHIDFPEGAKVIDVGTGAGFPGLVILLARPDLDMTFMDGTGKKLVFIESVMAETGVKGKLLHRRAEEAGQEPEFREQYDFAVARAVSNLTCLSEYCIPFLKTGGTFISMKSASAEDEVLSARNAIGILGGEIMQNKEFDLVENMKRRIILVKKISQTPSKYPRPSAKIAKNPLR